MKTYEISYNCESDNRVYNEKNTTTTKKNKAMKLYKVHFYKAYRADECETVWLPQIPENDRYYYSEVWETKEVELPDGVTYDQELNSFTCNGKDCDLVTDGDGTVSLVSADGIIKLF